MKVITNELRIDHRISGNLPYGYGVIFYGYNIMEENKSNRIKMVMQHPKEKNKLIIMNSTMDEVVELRKDKLKKFVDDLSRVFPHVVFCLAFPKKED